MKSLWQQHRRQELLERARRLTPEHRALWGKFTVAAMLTHVVDTFRMALGELEVRPKNKKLFEHPPVKQLIIYVLPFPRSAPTARELISRPVGDWQRELASFESYMQRFVASADRNDWPRHPLLGKMSRRAWGVLGYKHIDHHLRQFGV